MLPLDQIFLKVFQVDDSEAGSTKQDCIPATVAIPPCDLPDESMEVPQTISFPESALSATPQVIAFDQQGRSSKDKPVDTVDTEKEHVRFSDDFCPSRRFRKLYGQHREDVERTETVEPALKLHEETAEDPVENVSELISRRSIQEQALRLLAEQVEPEEDTEPDICEMVGRNSSCQWQHSFPICSTVQEEEIGEKVEEAPVVEDSADEKSEDTFKTIPVAAGKMPRVCRKMLDYANIELTAIGDVMEKTIASGHKVIGFKGAAEKCGSSTIILGAASELAARGLKVLVVDGSFEHPSLASSLGIAHCDGWDEAVFRKMPLESTMLRVNIPANEKKETESENNYFCFLPLIPQTVSRAIVASCKKDWLNKIIDLSDRFDLVLIDTGSYGPDSMEEKIQEMLRFGIDGFFIVKDTRSHTYAYIPELVDEVRKFDLCCLGIIENFA